MRSADAHLTPQELESLLFMAADSNVTTADRDATREAQQHLDGCDVCQGMAKRYANADSALRNLGPKVRLQSRSLQPPGGSGPGNDCPPEETWLRLSAGLIDNAAASLYVTHAAQCDWCGNLLREAMEDLTLDVTAEEQAAINKLGSADPAWQRELVNKLAAESGPAVSLAVATPARKKAEVKESKKLGWWPRLAFATVGLAVVAAAAWVVWQKLNPDPNKLLAEAYTEQRTLEPRIPGAKYGPLRVERGGDRSHLSRPTMLLDAEAIIGHQLERHPNDPDWLDKKARAELLENDYGPAIETLTLARKINPQSSLIATDLATAYYERAQEDGRPVDIGTAIELLGEVLHTAPDDKIALFNRALAYEKAFLFNEALADWEHYLRIDPSSDWAGEAQRRIEEIRKKIGHVGDGKSSQLLQPAEFVKLVRDSDAGTWVVIEPRIEDYVVQGIQVWLPKALSTPGHQAGLDGKELGALETLSKILMGSHHDSWLSDLLGSSEGPGFSKGIQALARAVQENSAGNPAAAMVASTQAERFFEQAQNLAGLRRAQLETVYALHRLFRGPECIRRSTILERDLADRAYSWIRAQLELEQFSCWTSLARFDKGRDSLEMAIKLSTESHYPVLLMRAVGFRAVLDSDTGNAAGAWLWDHDGLSKYWSGSYPPIRAFQFYDDLASVAEATDKWRLAVSLEREAVASIALTSNRVGEATARVHLARSAMRAGEWKEAAREFSLSEHIFSALSPNETILAGKADAQVGLADAEAHEGRFAQARKRLEAIRGDIGRLSVYTTQLNFYTTYAYVAWRQYENDVADQFCWSAVGIADRGLLSLHSERDRRTWTEQASDCYRVLVTSRISRQDFIGALELWEHYRGAGFGDDAMVARGKGQWLSFGREADPAHSRLVEQSLKSLRSSTVIVYAQLTNEIVVWVFDDRGVEERRVDGSPSQLSDLARRFTEECANPKSDLDALGVNARSLYNLLIAPLARRLDRKSWIVEPDVGFAELPFSLLMDQAGNYLGDDHDIAVSPGLAAMSALRPKMPISNTDHALVIAGPPVSDDPKIRLMNLPDASSEAENVARHFSKAVVLTGNRATAETVLRNLPNTDVLHFVGHAFMTPEGAVMLLYRRNNASGNASFLRPEQLLAAKPRHGKLIVLAACETGTIVTPDSAASDSVAQAFLRLGVPQVVASQWAVDSDSTAALMLVFYDKLLNGHSVVDSLREAGKSVRELPGKNHPYYWGGFSVFGRV